MNRPFRGTGRPAGGQPGDIDPGGIDGAVAQDLPHDPGDQRRLAPAADLVARIEPVPAPVGVRRRRLGGIGDEEAEFLRQHVHPRPRREIVRSLPAAVQHDDERQRGAGRSAGRGSGGGGDIELVAALALIAGEGDPRERGAPGNACLAACRGGHSGHAAGRDPGDGLGQTFPGLVGALGLAAGRLGLAGGRFGLAGGRLGRRPLSRFRRLVDFGERLQRIGRSAQVGGCSAAGRLGDRAPEEPEHLHPRSVVNRTGSPGAGFMSYAAAVPASSSDDRLLVRREGASAGRSPIWRPPGGSGLPHESGGNLMRCERLLGAARLTGCPPADRNNRYYDASVAGEVPLPQRIHPGASTSGQPSHRG